MTLILHGRNPTRLSELASSLAATPTSIHTVRADLAEMAQVHHLADEIAQVTDHLSVLVNNAGIGAGEPDGTGRQLTVDGHELRFAVNHLAPFALTQRLLPTPAPNARPRRTSPNREHRGAPVLTTH